MSTPIPEFVTTPRPKPAKKDLQPFKIDGELFHMRRPKIAALAAAASVLESGVPVDDPKNFRIMLSFCHQMISWIAEEAPDKDGNLRGRARIQRRLDDPDDGLDLENLMPAATSLLRMFMGRPTGSPPASTASRRQTPATPASRARTRSTRAKTSTTRTRSSR